MNLGNLFDKYGSDKNRNGYTPVYESIFKHWRPCSILEVGIGTMIPGAPSSMVGYALPGYRPGGSLRAWRDYFNQGMEGLASRTRVYGIDVAPDTQFDDEPLIKTFLADSRDSAALEKVLGDRVFDVIIDDGLHDHDAQLSTINNLLQHMNPGGFYVVEDIYPESPFLAEWDKVAEELGLKWFTTKKKNIMVVSL